MSHFHVQKLSIINSLRACFLFPAHQVFSFYFFLQWFSLLDQDQKKDEKKNEKKRHIISARIWKRLFTCITFIKNAKQWCAIVRSADKRQYIRKWKVRRKYVRNVNKQKTIEFIFSFVRRYRQFFLPFFHSVFFFHFSSSFLYIKLNHDMLHARRDLYSYCATRAPTEPIQSSTTKCYLTLQPSRKEKNRLTKKQKW